MISELPITINVVFGAAALFVVVLFYLATQQSRFALVLILTWMIVQLFLGASGFYKVTDTFPPRFLLLLLPPILLMACIFVSRAGKRFLDRLDIKYLTYLHTARIPIEIVLFWLFINRQIPQLMTFEGRNFDIVVGLTAPLIAYLVFSKNWFGNNVLLIWNLVSLGLLVNIVVNALLSAPTPFQQFGFEQPNVAVLYFPFVWLPSCIVPIVLFSHLATIRRILARP